jgi:hypothetical protein
LENIQVRKVGIIKGETQYDVMRTWCIELEKGFLKLGIEVVVYDFKYHHHLKFDDDVDFFVAFNGWTLPTLNDKVKKPIIMYLADHVNDHYDRILSLKNKDILTVMDRFDFEILEAINIQQNAYFLPHAALELSYLKTEKKIDVLFLGSYSNPKNFLEALDSITNIAPSVYPILISILNECLEDSNKHYFTYCLSKFKQYGLNVSITENKVLLEYINVIGRYIYSIKRENFLGFLADNGLKIHVYGNKWGESKLFNHPNIVFNSPVNYFEAQELIKKAKILVNMQPFLRDGTHERVFAGLANNTFVVSNKTAYLEKEFSRFEKIIFYEHENDEAVLRKIKDILNTVENDNFVDEILEYLHENHTYQIRAKNLIEIYKYHFTVVP